jgi:hypothetical protein
LLVAPGYTLRFLGSVGVAIILVFCVFFVLMHNVLYILGFSILLVAPGYTLRFLGSVGVAIDFVFCVVVLFFGFYCFLFVFLFFLYSFCACS